MFQSKSEEAMGLAGWRAGEAELARIVKAASSPSPERPRPLDPASFDKTLFQMLLDARARRGGKFNVIEDAERQPMSFDRLIIGASVLARKLAAMTSADENVGILLPNSNGAAVVFFACQAAGRVPAMLNFSTGIRNMLACCKTAQVRRVFTSRRFIALAKLEETIEALEREVEIVWLEDVRNSVTSFDKVRGVIDARLARRRYAKLGVKPTDPAVVLFTSGTEGVPKGVVLTHRNILSNCAQAAAVLDFPPDDKVFNALPMFHSFGLTAGFILPIFVGISAFLYPSPLHYRQIPPLIRDSRSTIVIATDTFVNGWAKNAEAGDFASLRLLVLGAERVKPQTREIFRKQYGVELFEGYGVTETAPVLAVNTFDHAREGTVGRLLPGIEYRIDPVLGLEQGGRLVVRGPNVMAGYMTLDAPGVLKPPADEWHDTGDIVTVDEDGYVTIAGRAKRFAKIGGEMVSLAAVEGYAASVWPENMHAVVAVPDERKGEQLVMITDRANADRQELLAWVRAHGVPELHIPKRFIFVAELPVMGTGKLDYMAVQRLANG